MKLAYSDPSEIRERANLTPSSVAKDIFFCATSMGHFIADSKYFVLRSQLPSLLIVYTISGNGALTYQDKEFKTKAKDLFIIDCNQFQHYRTFENLWDFYYIHVVGENAFKFYNLIVQNKGIIFNVSFDFIKTWYEIYRLTSGTGIENEAKISFSLHGLFNSMLADNKEIKSFIDTEKLIQQYYKEHITIGDMAKAECMSKFHFCHSFKKYYGIPPYEYLINYRIDMAKKLLIDNKSSLNDITEQCGFDSVSNFINSFKRVVGVTPGVYKKHGSDL